MSALLRVGWSWYPSVLIGFAIWTLCYEAAVWRGKPIRLWQRLAFHTGTLFGLIALVSPLDGLGDEYLFSAHMVQHMLLMFVTAPLWLLGAPGWMVDAVLPNRLIGPVKHVTRPLNAFLLFVSVMWLWHIPAIYELAQENETVHVLEHLMYIGAACLGWWPALGGDAARIDKPAPLLRMLYLFLLGISCTALAAVLTFSPTPLYPFYVSAPHPFGLNALEDQRLGGLLMWLPTHMVLLAAIAAIFRKWFDQDRRSASEELNPLIAKDLVSHE